MQATVTAFVAKGFQGRHVATKVNEKKVVVATTFVRHGEPTVLDFDETTLAWAKADRGLRVVDVVAPAPEPPKQPAKGR